MKPWLRLLPCFALIVLIANSGLSGEKKTPVPDGWGKVINPDGDCTVKMDKGKLTISVPKTLHDLNPRSGKLNAPRVMLDVEGDFAVQVRVSGEFMPGKRTTAPKSHPFIGAGLLIWSDEQNYVRLERNAWWRADLKRHFCYPPLLEYFKNGEDQNTNPQDTAEPFFKGPSTSLRLERKGDTISAALSHDGKKWIAVREITTDLPNTVSVGVLAINTSDRIFKVDFDEFKLVKK